jgi:hypothetical protein
VETIERPEWTWKRGREREGDDSEGGGFARDVVDKNDNWDVIILNVTT